MTLANIVKLVVTLVIFTSCIYSFSLMRTTTIRTMRRQKDTASKLFVVMSSDGAKGPLNKYSRTITEPPSQGASQAMLYATGLNPDTITRPQVGIGSVWFEGNPCNMHLLYLSELV